MRINWLSYIEPFASQGGGEAVVKRLLESGRQLGHELHFSHVFPAPKTDFQDDEDLNVLVDIHNLPRRRRRFPQHLLAEIVAHRRYVHLDNAYVDLCDLDDYLPCNGAHSSPCPYKRNPFAAICKRRSPWSVLLSRGCPVTQRTELYARAALCVFLSPLHAQVAKKMAALPDLPCFILRPLMDTGLFRNEGRERDIENLFVGVISEAKGLENMRAQYQDKPITLVGSIRRPGRVDFGTHVPHVPYEQVAEYMNRARHFVYLPRWPEPQGRVVPEAALCGCKLITNENVGATSFDFDLSDPAQYKGCEQEFWQKLEDTAKQ